MFIYRETKNEKYNRYVIPIANQSNSLRILEEVSTQFDKKLELNSKEVYFGIRPEHIYYKKNNENDFEIKLKADLSEYIGHEQIITFNYSNQEVLAKFPSTTKIEINKEMNLYFDLAHISLFDKNSKERI